MCYEQMSTKKHDGPSSNVWMCTRLLERVSELVSEWGFGALPQFYARVPGAPKGISANLQETCSIAWVRRGWHGCMIAKVPIWGRTNGCPQPGMELVSATWLALRFARCLKRCHEELEELGWSAPRIRAALVCEGWLSAEKALDWQAATICLGCCV